MSHEIRTPLNAGWDDRCTFEYGLRPEQQALSRRFATAVTHYYYYDILDFSKIEVRQTGAGTATF